jgi:hypothetical protein
MTGLTTTHLSLPLIAPAQAQKHVPHNEAIWALDALTHLSVPQAERNDPPAVPVDGGRHIVGPAPTGDWAGHAGEVAVRRDAAWLFLVPRAGWVAWAEAEGALLVHDGAGWAVQGGAGGGGGGTPGRVPELGIGTDADATNVLSVAGPATLLSHSGAGHRLTLNKAGPPETASLLFQSGWSGRAEMGLAGQDDFSIKVSADGAAWHEAIRCDAATGAVTMPGGLAGTGSAAGALGGQVVALTCERRSYSGGTYFSFGHGSTNGTGPLIPFDAQLVAMTGSGFGGAASQADFEVQLDQVALPGATLTVPGAGGGAGKGIADFRGAPPPVPANASLSVYCTQNGGLNNTVITVFLRFV